jgi:hypothetical protein
MMTDGEYRVPSMSSVYVTFHRTKGEQWIGGEKVAMTIQMKWNTTFAQLRLNPCKTIHNIAHCKRQFKELQNLQAEFCCKYFSTVTQCLCRSTESVTDSLLRVFLPPSVCEDQILRLGHEN